MTSPRILTLALAFAPWSLACDLAVADLFRDRAVRAYTEGRLAEAASELRVAVRTCPGEARLHFMLGNALYRSGRIADSADSYKAAVALEPSHFEAQMCLGFALFESGDMHAAVQQWTAAMRLDTGSAFARAALAVGLWTMGDEDNAVIQSDVATRLEARYRDPAALAVDVRWKPTARRIWVDVRRQSEKQTAGERSQ